MTKFNFTVDITLEADYPCCKDIKARASIELPLSHILDMLEGRGEIFDEYQFTTKKYVERIVNYNTINDILEYTYPVCIKLVSCSQNKESIKALREVVLEERKKKVEKRLSEDLKRLKEETARLEKLLNDRVKS